MIRFKGRYQRTKTKCRREKTGFTLMEVMVALTVMSIVLVSVYRMHSQSLTMISDARFYTLAPMLAQSKLAELEVLSASVFPEESGDFGENHAGYGWKVSVSDVSSEILGAVAEDFKQIDITVAFNNDQMSYNLRTYRFKRE